MTLAIHHKSLRLILSPFDVFLWDPSPSDLWDPTTCVTLVLVDPSPSDLWDLMAPFSISIRPMGPGGLRVTCTYRTFLHLHRPVGPDGLRVTCGPFSI
jgi:hypothetical protein